MLESSEIICRTTLQGITAQLGLFIIGLASAVSIAADDEALAEMARKAQDPLGDVKALMTDNTIAFGGGPSDETSYGFQLQPVYAIDNATRLNMIARAIIPIIGVEPGVVIPPIGPEQRPDQGSEWGIGDTILQYFLSPKSDAKVKWGIGPQVSLKTRTSKRQAGPGWGAGIAAVLFGGAGNWALGTVAMQHWGDAGSFSMATIQGIAIYNFETMPGVYAGYNNSITYNWDADTGQKLTLPIGLTVGRTLLLNNGDGLDLSVGVYDLVEAPDEASDWQFKFGVSYFFN